MDVAKLQKSSKPNSVSQSSTGLAQDLFMNRSTSLFLNLHSNTPNDDPQATATSSKPPNLHRKSIPRKKAITKDLTTLTELNTNPTTKSITKNIPDLKLNHHIHFAPTVIDQDFQDETTPPSKFDKQTSLQVHRLLTLSRNPPHPLTLHNAHNRHTQNSHKKNHNHLLPSLPPPTKFSTLLSDRISLSQLEYISKHLKAKKNWTKALSLVQKHTTATSIFRKSFQKSRAKGRWYFAINTVVKLLRATRLFNVRHSGGDDSGRGVELFGNGGGGVVSSGAKSLGADSRGLTWALRIIDCKASVILASKVQELLSRRTQDMYLPLADLQELDRLLCRLIKYYSKFKQKQRYKFCKAAHYECFGAGTQLIAEGHRPTFFYLLLSGQCEEHHNSAAGAKIVTALLDAGTVFGHMTDADDEKRTSSIISTLETEVLRVDKDDYLDILRAEESEVAKTKLEMFKKHPSFCGVVESAERNGDSECLNVVSKLCKVSEIVEFEPHDVIVSEGVPTQFIYLLVEGTCKALKAVPFVVKPETKLHGDMILPYLPKLRKEKKLGGSGSGDQKSELNILRNTPEQRIHQDGIDEVADTKEETFNKEASQTNLASSLPNLTDANTQQSPPQLHLSEIDVSEITRKTLESQKEEQSYHVLKGERVIHQVLSIYQIFAGASFPELLSSSSRLLRRLNDPNSTITKMSIIEELTAAKFSLSETLGTLNNYSNHDSVRKNRGFTSHSEKPHKMSPFRENVLTSQFSIVAKSKVVCLRLEKVDFVRLASNEVVNKELKKVADGIVDFTIEKVHDMYCQKKGWEMLKKSAVKEVVDASSRKILHQVPRLKKIPLVTVLQ
ncbi:hypothetical protein HK098_005223 [Nowakowskiella sp. JEL0407]|nr:hypothetical protein HK098_005223 [Nowakowskiella sp. JEL0407]